MLRAPLCMHVCCKEHMFLHSKRIYNRVLGRHSTHKGVLSVREWLMARCLARLWWLYCTGESLIISQRSLCLPGNIQHIHGSRSSKCPPQILMTCCRSITRAVFHGVRFCWNWRAAQLKSHYSPRNIAAEKCSSLIERSRTPAPWSFRKPICCTMSPRLISSWNVAHTQTPSTPTAISLSSCLRKLPARPHPGKGWVYIGNVNTGGTTTVQSHYSCNRHIEINTVNNIVACFITYHICPWKKELKTKPAASQNSFRTKIYGSQQQPLQSVTKLHSYTETRIFTSAKATILHCVHVSGYWTQILGFSLVLCLPDHIPHASATTALIFS